MTWAGAMIAARSWAMLTGERYRVAGYVHRGRWRYAISPTVRRVQLVGPVR